MTNKQRMVYDLYNSGMKQSDIAKELGCSRQNVSNILKSIRGRRSGESGKIRNDENGINGSRIDYSQYMESDMTILSDRQRIALLLRMEEKTYAEIAEALSVSVEAANSLLQVARMKCEGRWDAHETKVCERNKVYNLKNRERKTLAAREYREKNREKYKKYQQEYYKNNKERSAAKRKGLKDADII